jgi:DNA-binding FadR family transcriptional regulator
MEFVNVKEKRLFEKIVDQIKDAVLSGSLKPGDALPGENELARRLGVSRTALREALRILDAMRKSIVRAEELYREGQQIEKLYENFNFHILLAKATKNRIVVDMLSAIADLMAYIMSKIKPSARMAEKTFKVHRELVELLALGEWEKAKAINGAHIMELSVKDPEFRLRLPLGHIFPLSTVSRTYTKRSKRPTNGSTEA